MSGLLVDGLVDQLVLDVLAPVRREGLEVPLVRVGHLLGAEDAGRGPGVVAVDDHDDLLADGAVAGRLGHVGRGDVPARPLHVVPVEGIGLRELVGIRRPGRHLAVVRRGREQQLAVGGLQHARVDGERGLEVRLLGGREVCPKAGVRTSAARASATTMSGSLFIRLPPSDIPIRSSPRSRYSVTCPGRCRKWSRSRADVFLWTPAAFRAGPPTGARRAPS